MNAILTFQDHGQDFLTWQIEKDRVVDCTPFQASTWVGSQILNPDELAVGKCVVIKCKHKSSGTLEIKYPLEGFKLLPDAFGYDVDIELNAGGAGRAIIQKHWKAKSYRAVLRKALLVKCAVRVVKIMPLSEKEYCQTYGDPRVRSRFN